MTAIAQPPSGPAASSAPAGFEGPPAEDVVVRASAVRKRYITGTTELWALRGISLDIRRGEYLSIMGPSGSGKSTFFNMVGVLDKPTDGTVYIDGQDTASMDKYQLAWLRNRKIGYIFQTFNLVTVMTALENVTLPMTLAGLNQNEANDKGAEILKSVGLGHRLDHRPAELSGGQQQRVAIARSLANDPAIVLADEPTGNLDLRTGEEIIELLGKLQRDRGVTIITATHDHKMLAASDRVVWIKDGSIDKVLGRNELQIDVGQMH